MNHTMHVAATKIVYMQKEKKMYNLFQPHFMDKLKTQMWILKLWKKEIGREYFYEPREMNCFPREMPRAQIIKGKIDFLFLTISNLIILNIKIFMI